MQETGGKEKEMTIEITKKGTREFYKEVVNVTSQYRQLLVKPDGKLSDNFKKNILLTVAMAIFFVTDLYIGITSGFRMGIILPMVLAVMASVAMIIYLKRLNDMVNGYLEDDRPATVTLDDEGVEIARKDAQAIRLAWDNVAFVRVFGESTCFFSKDLSGIVLAVTNDHRKEIMEYLKENDHGVRVIK